MRGMVCAGEVDARQAHTHRSRRECVIQGTTATDGRRRMEARDKKHIPKDTQHEKKEKERKRKRSKQMINKPSNETRGKERETREQHTVCVRGRESVCVKGSREGE